MHQYDERIIPHRDYVKSHAFFAEHLARYQFADRLFPRDGVVLDLCCGCGYGSAHLAEMSGRTVLGLDVASDALAYACQQYRSPRLQYIRADVMSVPVQQASVDAVLALEAIEHLHDPVSVLRQVRKVLKPGGMFLVSTPNRLVTKSGAVPANPFHVREYTPEEFMALLGEVFPSVSLYGEALSPAFLVYERSLQRLWRSVWLMRGLYYEQREAIANIERMLGLPWLRAVKRKLRGRPRESTLPNPETSRGDAPDWEANLRAEFERAEGAVASMADWQITPYQIEAAPILLGVCRIP